MSPPGALCATGAIGGSNSLLAGNLAGNLQNGTGIAPFGLPERLDGMKYQDVRREFPVPGKAANFRGVTGIWSQDIGASCGARRCSSAGLVGPGANLGDL
jgi:hypothetical protein